MSLPPSPPFKKHWWITNKQVAEKQLRQARALIQTQDPKDIQTALNLIEPILESHPKWEKALELKARALLYQKKFKEVAGMLQEYIPSLRFTELAPSESSGSSFASREQVHLLPTERQGQRWSDRCFSLFKFKEKLFSGLSRDSETEDWKFLVLGQACCHLGMLEDALVLLQSGKRAASSTFRRESTRQNGDTFQIDNPPSEFDNVSYWLNTIKLLLRKKTAAMAALDAGLFPEAIRLFTKILEGRRGSPQGFVAECYMLRAMAYQAAGRVTDAIADCNRTLALDPTCIDALITRASLFESVRCFTESLQDMEHVKLLYESILRHQKFNGPVWKFRNIGHKNIERKLEGLNPRILAMKRRLTSPFTLDYYSLVGLSRGCTRTDLEKTHLLLCLRHRPEKANHFVDRCEFVDARDIDSVKEQARLSALMLYRLLQKAYTFIMDSIMEKEAETQKQLKGIQIQMKTVTMESRFEAKHETDVSSEPDKKDVDGEYQQILLPVSSNTLWAAHNSLESRTGTVFKANNLHDCKTYENEDLVVQDFADATSSFQAVSCRDVVVVGNILPHALPKDTWMSAYRGHPLAALALNYEALSC